MPYQVYIGMFVDEHASHMFHFNHATADKRGAIGDIMELHGDIDFVLRCSLHSDDEYHFIMHCVNYTHLL